MGQPTCTFSFAEVLSVDSIRLQLTPQEYQALARLADHDLRPIPDTARYVIRQTLVRRGLLVKAQPKEAAGA